MWIDLLAIAVLALFVLSGAVRGALASGLALLTLAGSYVVALVLAPSLGREVADGLQLPLVLGMGVAGAGAFAVAFIVFGLVAAGIRWMERSRRGDLPRSLGDRFLGAGFGAVRGVMLALLLGVLGYWLQAFETLAPEQKLPHVGPSTVAAVSQAVVASAAEALVDPDSPGGRLTVRAVAQPAETFSAVQGLLEDPRLLQLRDDPGFWSSLEAGDVDGATRRVSFATIAYNQQLRERFAESGFVTPEAAADPEAFRMAVSGALAEVGPRIRDLRNDPELQRLAQDPEVVAMMQAGDTLGLLRHPGFRRLVDRVTAG